MHGRSVHTCQGLAEHRAGVERAVMSLMFSRHVDRSSYAPRSHHRPRHAARIVPMQLWRIALWDCRPSATLREQRMSRHAAPDRTAA